ncbi:MAG: bifunctional diaminohydroxyphosphoribosylaminopyrimidine deaminase/5-amino-6-(5-phosphoribosylamino)uracil reductase RibD [Egibacteraceae bacterium]
MDRAFVLAERGRGTVSPNPLVGCVVARDGKIVGEGWHERTGGPHAEVVALAAAGDLARGATVYVTLEPCAHTGCTAPCSQALVGAGVARVVAALADPNPLAEGGADQLRAAGIDVDVGVDEARARRQNEVFLHGLDDGLPFVVWKTAVSLDGRIAAADGTSRWLTGPAAREHAHRLRAEVDAVLVGSETVLTDDPQLAVRLPGYPGPQPLRVVLDRRRRLAERPGLRVFDDAAPTLVLDAPDPKAVLATLWERGVRSVLVEGGAAVGSAFARAGLVDKLVVHVAPLLLGESGRPALRGDWPVTLDAVPRLHLEDVERVGDDVILTLYPDHTGAT